MDLRTLGTPRIPSESHVYQVSTNGHRRTQFEDVAKQRPQLSDSEISQAPSSLSKCYRVYANRRQSTSFTVYTYLLEARTVIYTVQPHMNNTRALNTHQPNLAHPNLTVILPARGRLTRWTTCDSQSENDQKATSLNSLVNF